MLTKVILIAISSLILSNLIKEIKSEYSIYITITASIAMLSVIIFELKPVIDNLNRIASDYCVDSKLFVTISKICIIGYIKTFVVNLCNDYGHSSVADKVDFAARIAMISLCFPWIKELLVNINKLL